MQGETQGLINPRGSDVVTGKTHWGNHAAIWLLGLFNNAIFVILNAGAAFIVPGGVGVIYFCNNVPSLLVTITGPYWFHLVSYRNRVILCTFAFASGVSLVALAEVIWLRLLGILIGSFAQGLGECSMLGLMSYYGRGEVTAWSSGTGFAGIFGYAFKALCVDFCQLSFKTTLLLANLIPLGFLGTFLGLLVKPFDQNSRSPSSESLSGASYLLLDHNDETNNNRENDAGQGNNGMIAKFRIFCSLWRFSIPLFLVYLTEYVMQSGTWASFGFPVHSQEARGKFYLYSNWLYQVGVFFSRSSGAYFHLGVRELWLMPFLQTALLCFFTLDAIYHFWWDYSILVVCFFVGCLGGAVYVHSFCIMGRTLPYETQEFSMAAVTAASSIGIAMANVIGVILQGCLFAINDITDQGRPLFTCGKREW